MLRPKTVATVLAKPEHGVFLHRTPADQQAYLRSLQGPNYPSGCRLVPAQETRKQPRRLTVEQMKNALART
jgi:hypothetical protein